MFWNVCIENMCVEWSVPVRTFVPVTKGNYPRGKYINLRAINEQKNLVQAIKVSAHSSYLLRAIIARNKLPFWKILLNLVQFLQNLPKNWHILPFFIIFLPFLWTIAPMPSVPRMSPEGSRVAGYQRRNQGGFTGGNSPPFALKFSFFALFRR